MNERLEELKLLATYDSSFDGGPHYEVDADTLVQLVIQECTLIIAEAVKQREPASTYVSKIKQHFGVEK